jgi:hypothetical protein
MPSAGPAFFECPMLIAFESHRTCIRRLCFPIFSPTIFLLAHILHSSKMPVRINNMDINALYIATAPRTVLSSSFVHAHCVPCTNNGCNITISIVGDDSPFAFSQAINADISQLDEPISLLLGQDWYSLSMNALAGHSVRIGNETVVFPHRLPSVQSCTSLYIVFMKLVINYSLSMVVMEQVPAVL